MSSNVPEASRGPDTAVDAAQCLDQEDQSGFAEVGLDLLGRLIADRLRVHPVQLGKLQSRLFRG